MLDVKDGEWLFHIHTHGPYKMSTETGKESTWVPTVPILIQSQVQDVHNHVNADTLESYFNYASPNSQQLTSQEN